jgi:hypothetical protein
MFTRNTDGLPPFTVWWVVPLRLDLHFGFCLQKERESQGLPSESTSEKGRIYESLLKSVFRTGQEDFHKYFEHGPFLCPVDKNELVWIPFVDTIGVKRLFPPAKV